MSYLLDTHSFVWAALQPGRLSSRARVILEDPAAEVLVSAVTFWEIALKSALGKLTLEGCTPESLVQTAQDQRFGLLALESHTAAGVARLPSALHRDPFDRMLVWQAISGRHTLVTRDRALSVFSGYGLCTLW